MRKASFALVAFTCFTFGIWLTPQYYINPVRYQGGIQPRCSIRRVGVVEHVSEQELRERYSIPDEISSLPSGEWTVIANWTFDCSDLRADENIWWSNEELELIARLMSNQQ